MLPGPDVEGFHVQVGLDPDFHNVFLLTIFI